MSTNPDELGSFRPRGSLNFRSHNGFFINETRFQKGIVCYDDKATDQLHIQPLRCRSWRRRREIEELGIAGDIGSVGVVKCLRRQQTFRHREKSVIS